MLSLHRVLQILLVLLIGTLGALTPAVFQGKLPYPFDAVEALQTFTYGYAAMEERTLKDITAGELALEGLQGLVGLSPEVALYQEGDSLLLFNNERLVSNYPLPRDVDAGSWGRLTVTVITEARALSGNIAKASLEEIYQAIFDSALGRLDVFSRYAGAEEAARNRENRNGFGGIGIEFQLSRQGIIITDVIPKTPAYFADLRSGDILTHIDGIPISHAKTERVTDLLRGSVGSLVLLDWLRDGQIMTAHLSRMRMMDSVDSAVSGSLMDGVAVIVLKSFNDDISWDLKDIIIELRNEAGAGWRGIILDLRGNPGGLLDQAIAVSDLFLDSGVIVQTEGRHPYSSVSYQAQKGEIGEDIPLVVLMDGLSASAAEIVAAALQDNQRALVVGRNSYGKGTVQTIISLPNGGEIALTWSRFMSPSGHVLQNIGVRPNICTIDLLPFNQKHPLQSQARDSCSSENMQETRGKNGEDIDIKVAQQLLPIVSPIQNHR